jgi:adenylyltransferase/sulfurtransferase
MVKNAFFGIIGDNPSKSRGGFMLPELTAQEMKRYSRHLILSGFGLQGQQKLKKASALVVGVGGLGSAVSLYLAAAGLGNIGIVDQDVVDDSNLQRQIIHDTGMVGQPKVLSARQRMLAINPEVRVRTYQERFTAENALQISQDFDILVDGTDNFAARYLLNDLAVLTGKPYVFGAIANYEGQVSFFNVGDGPCYRCIFPNIPPEGMPVLQGVFNPLPGTIGTIEASETIKLITGIGVPLVGRMLLYDALEMSFHIVGMHKNPRCRICGEKPEITTL